MNNDWHFFVNGFMSFMLGEFPEPMSNHFTYDLLENTVNKLLELTEDRVEFIDWLTEILPEVEREELEYFINR